MTVPAARHTGAHGEAVAAAYLEERGCTILERNYRFERAEVDLVCFDPKVGVGELVFVEVKTRRGLGFGRPEEAVDAEKRRHLFRAAEAYLYERRMEGALCRFDVIGIILHDDRPPEIEHFENAFWSF